MARPARFANAWGMNPALGYRRGAADSEVCMAVIPDSHRYLLDAPVAVLGTVGPDGRPQMSQISTR